MNVYYQIQVTNGGRNGTCWAAVSGAIPVGEGVVLESINMGGYLVPASDTSITAEIVEAYGSWTATEPPLDYTSIIQPFAFPFIGSMAQWDGTTLYMNLGWSGVPYNLSCFAIVWAQTP